MKFELSIPFTNISIGNIFNKHEKPITAQERQQIIGQITIRQLHRNKTEIDGWRSALELAESVEIPTRVELIRIYKEIVLDTHISALMGTIIVKILSGGYWLENAEGKRDEEATKTIQSRWFRNILIFSIESDWWGHSLIQLGPIKGKGFEWAKIIPREYVIPEKHGVTKDLHITDDLVDWTLPPFDKWVISVGEPNDLGKLCKAAPHAIWKKNAFKSWAQYTEIFGQPLIIGRTNVTDPKAKQNMDDALKNMGSAFRATLALDDLIEFVETKQEDAYEVFNMLIERANSEMSKLFLGQTMTTDDGSSKSQATVHENVLKDYITARKEWLTDIAQDDILPKLEIHNIIPSDRFIKFGNAEKITLLQKAEIVKIIGDLFKIPEKYIKDNFDIDVLEKAIVTTPGEPSNSLVRIENELENLYSSYFRNLDHNH